MIQSLLTKETPEIIRFFRNIDSLSEMLDKQEEKLRPVLNGERYITDRELAEQLKLTRRTLAEYRINGKLPYYKIGGKLLYKEKDILALLEKNRMEAFDVLKQNQAFTHSIGSNYYDYINSNVLKPYAMISFVYTIR